MIKNLTIIFRAKFHEKLERLIVKNDFSIYFSTNTDNIEKVRK